MTTHILAHDRADLTDYCRQKHIGHKHVQWITAACDLRGEHRGKLVVLPSAWTLPLDQVETAIRMAVVRGFQVRDGTSAPSS